MLVRSGGLAEVADPSARFVGEASTAPGSVVLASMEGTRPLLVEVQALVAPTEVVPPRRIANGVDRNRLAMILAVLARHAGFGLGAADVFVNVAGGVRVEEPGADLAVALAIASAHRGHALADAEGCPLACFGEVGLTGELRFVAHAERRIAEAQKFGLGPTVVALRQDSGWTYGLLANHIVSTGGTSSTSDVNATFLQPFLSYTTNAYLGRMVDLIMSDAKQTLHLETHYETDMAEGLKMMALEGRGIAFLPESAVTREVKQKLLALADGGRAEFEIEMDSSR